MSPQDPPLTRDRVLEGAVELADLSGVETLTIRRLADHLGRRPMSLYHHLPNKEAILEGMIDRVFGELVVPELGGGWRSALEERCRSLRKVLRRHPWAVPLMDACRAPGPATLKHHDATLGVLFDAGFTNELAAHAVAILDAFVYGFVLQEASLPFSGPAELAELAESILGSVPASERPNLHAFTREHVLQPEYSFGDSFEVGMGLLLDGLQAKRADSNG